MLWVFYKWTSSIVSLLYLELFDFVALIVGCRCPSCEESLRRCSVLWFCSTDVGELSIFCLPDVERWLSAHIGSSVSLPKQQVSDITQKTQQTCNAFTVFVRCAKGFLLKRKLDTSGLRIHTSPSGYDLTDMSRQDIQKGKIYRKKSLYLSTPRVTVGLHFVSTSAFHLSCQVYSRNRPYL